MLYIEGSRGLSRPRLVQSSDGVANLRQRDNGMFAAAEMWALQLSPDRRTCVDEWSSPHWSVTLGQAFMDHVNLRQVLRPEDYGIPAVLSFDSGACSGCGSVLGSRWNLDRPWLRFRARQLSSLLCE